MKKKLLHLLFVFLLATCMISLKNSCSLAFSNITEFENDIKAKLNILKENNVIGTNFSYNNIGPAYDQYFDYMIILRSNDKTNGQYTKIWVAYTRRSKANPVQNAYSNHWGKTDYWVGAKSFNINTGAIIDSYNNYEMLNWSFDYIYTTIAIDTTNMTLGEGEEYGQYYITEPPSTFNFVFYDTSHTATTPDGETAYCVFVDPMANEQKIGYIENYSEHQTAQIFIFAINYRNASDPLVNSIGETNYYINESGELLVNPNTMWTALVYQITGIDNGPSGDFLNGENFITYYYIASGSNTSGDPLFNGYDANYDNPQFFLWKLLGDIGDGSGDKGSGILGGISSLFIPDKDFFVNYFNTFDDWFSNHLGLLYTPFELVFDILERINEVDFSNPQMSFGPFTLPLNDDAVLVPLTTINFNDFLEDETFEEIHNIYLIIIDGLIVCGLLYMLYCKYEEIVGGKD